MQGPEPCRLTDHRARAAGCPGLYYLYSMSTDAIHKVFAEKIRQTGIHRQMGISQAYVMTMRYKVRIGIPIKLETKLRLLQRAGWSQDELRYTRHDLVAAVRAALNAGSTGKQLGAEYLVEKFLNLKS